MRLLIEHALTFLPSQPCVVQTPQGPEYEGGSYSGKGITGVSILRAGETMEPALRAVCKDVRIGKILIQTNLDSGEPEVAETSTQLLCYSAEHLKMTSTIVL
ncbi:Uridine-cytidine kinase-like 1 [Xenoophorus captivus]|uniref:Uridine-cytidine kinase-like 1 n=1 Tax=Xenoophorus captivus TaxID=1517983 RepID=A0ABV0QEI2_9TELE